MIQFFGNGHTPKIIKNPKVKEKMTTDGHIYVGEFNSSDYSTVYSFLFDLLD